MNNVTIVKVNDFKIEMNKEVATVGGMVILMIAIALMVRWVA